MSPAATAKRAPSAPQRTSAPQRSRSAATPRPGLRVLDQRSRRRRRRRVGPALCLTLLVLSLLSVVVGHALLAQGQVQLSAAQAALSAAQATHRQEVLSVSALETPGRIAQDAQGTLHMVPPGQVHQLPYVSLDVPLPPPTLSAPTSSTSSSNSTASG